MIVTCPQCGLEMEAPAKAAGHAARCIECGTTFDVPRPHVIVLEDPEPEPIPPSTVADEPASPADDDQPLSVIDLDDMADEQDPAAELARQMGHPRRGRGKRHAGLSDALAEVSGEEYSEQAPRVAEGVDDLIAATSAPARRKRSARLNKGWYVVLSDEAEWGPMTDAQMVAAVRAGKMSPGVCLRRAGDDAVFRVADIQRYLDTRNPGND